ncbi:MAG: hypothetical protein WDM92_02300 [Caulobacteraceae bacterium]
MKRLLLSIAAVTALAACETVPPPPSTLPEPEAAPPRASGFHAEDFAWSSERGTATLPRRAGLPPGRPRLQPAPASR